VNKEWGSVGSELRTLIPVQYGDGVSSPNGADRPNARLVSNSLFKQSESILDGHNLTDYMWVFGQFVEHDISYVPKGTESAAIEVPACDPIFDPTCTGASQILMNRSLPSVGTGTSPENPRHYANHISGYLDGSAIYGSDEARANWLRTFSDGKLKMSQGELLPFNTVTGELNGATDRSAPLMDISNPNQTRYFVAGDVRANENMMLTTLHTLFIREHNRKCDEIKLRSPELSDEQIYQKARKMIGGYIQKIVYHEWLPSMGVELDEYSGYKQDVNVNVSNVFSSSAYRFCYTLLNSHLLLMKDDCNKSGQDLNVTSSYFNHELLITGGIESLVKGMSAQVQQKLDAKVVDEVRNIKVSPGIGIDHAAMNINLGRERGLPDYNTVRSMLGLGKVKTFDEVSDNPEDVRILEELYGTADNLDPWVGMLIERHLPGAMFGETIMAIIKEQFIALRDGDRFYFEIDPELSEEEKDEIRAMRMGDLIERNTPLQSMQENVFFMEKKCHKVEVDAEHLAIHAYPNPIQGDFHLNLYSFAAEDAEMVIVDLMGKKIASMKLSVDKGANNYYLNLGPNIPPGMYNLQIHQGQLFKAIKILRAY